MMNWLKRLPRGAFAMILPLIVIPAVLLVVMIIGETLLALAEINKGVSVAVALLITFGAIFGAMYLDSPGFRRSTGVGADGQPLTETGPPPRSVYWVLGLFANGDAAGTGVESLVQAGFGKRDISVMSPVPLPPDAYGLDTAKGKLWTPWATLIGAVVGAITGFLVSGGTAWLYPLNTGGKAIIAMPAVGVLIYEFTMLFATLFTVVATLYNQYLPSYGAQPYAPEVSDGRFAVVVPCPSVDDATRAEQSLSVANAMAVRRDPFVTL